MDANEAISVSYGAARSERALELFESGVDPSQPQLNLGTSRSSWRAGRTGLCVSMTSMPRPRSESPTPFSLSYRYSTVLYISLTTHSLTHTSPTIHHVLASAQGTTPPKSHYASRCAGKQMPVHFRIQKDAIVSSPLGEVGYVRAADPLVDDAGQGWMAGWQAVAARYEAIE